MLDVKLQIGCLLVVLYFTAEYMKDTLQKKLPCNGYFDAILIIAPWAIVFDGITAWTVNHMDQVPGWFNMICHALFFILMDMLTVAIFFIHYSNDNRYPFDYDTVYVDDTRNCFHHIDYSVYG